MKNKINTRLKPISAIVDLHGSKSIANRAILIASIAKGASILQNIPLSDDVLACIEAIKILGVKFDLNKNNRIIKIIGCDGVFPIKKATIDCCESGTLTRFIIPLCASQNIGEYSFVASQRMMLRPLSQQILALEKLGANIVYSDKKNKLPLTIFSQGLSQNIDNHLTIDCNKSSQFASGLLLASPYFKSDFCLNTINGNKEPYVKMTQDIMSKFSAKITCKKSIYKTQSTYKYIANDYFIEPDVSTASYFWAAAAITNGTVKINNINIESMQGDIFFLEIIKKMGCKIKSHDSGIEVLGSKKLSGINIDMQNCSDTFMTVAAIACFAESSTKITGLNHARLQESDRILAMVDGLKALGVFVIAGDESIFIDPIQSKIKGGVVKSYNDHRIAMSLALIGLRVDGVIIDGAECVAKTCPDYFFRMNTL